VIGMTTFRLEPQYLFKLVSMPRGFTTHDPIGNKCNVPSHTITIDYLGNCLLCSCDGWLPIPVGKVLEFDSIEQVLQSESAKLIREDVENGFFSWCAVDHCGIRDQDKIKHEFSLSINIDESCNLHCPSCRRDAVMLDSGPEFDFKISCVNRILEWLEKFDKPIHITMSGNGDPLASHVMRPLIKNWKPKNNQRFTIFTNGLLLQKQLENLPILDRVKEFKISVDAGSEAVYHDVRRPGNWTSLLKNLEWLNQIGQSSRTCLNFALQNKNYQDLPKFIELCQQFGFRGVVHQLDNWGTWSQIESGRKDTWTMMNGLFRDHDVLDKNHPNHAHACQVIKQHLVSDNIFFAPALLGRIRDE